MPGKTLPTRSRGAVFWMVVVLYALWMPLLGPLSMKRSTMSFSLVTASGLGDAVADAALGNTTRGFDELTIGLWGYCTRSLAGESRCVRQWPGYNLTLVPLASNATDAAVGAPQHVVLGSGDTFCLWVFAITPCLAALALLMLLQKRSSEHIVGSFFLLLQTLILNSVSGLTRFYEALTKAVWTTPARIQIGYMAYLLGFVFLAIVASISSHVRHHLANKPQCAAAAVTPADGSTDVAVREKGFL